MSKLSMFGTGDVNAVADILLHELNESAFSCELVDSVDRTVGDARIITMVFEKYYWRSSNYASLTVVICGENGRISVDAIGSAGGQSLFLKMSWGAEKDFVSTVENVLLRQGFHY